MYCREDYEFIEPMDEFGFEYDESFNHYYSVDNDSSTLVIHPEDPTTDFLKKVYRNKNYNVIDDPFIDSSSLEDYILEHKRIIALGHGCDSGLFGAFGMIIDSSLVPILKEKDLICIWCNADRFMLNNDLRGLYSGMFISEVNEARMYNIETDQDTVSRSNDLFSELLGKYLDSEGDVLAQLNREYHIENDPIITFNRNRLYCT
jgi:hypothetical protein